MSTDSAVARLANRNASFADIRDHRLAAKTLAPSRHPERWCLCRNAGCIGWSTYLTEAVAWYGHEPTEQEMTDDAKIRMAARAHWADGGAR